MATTKKAPRRRLRKKKASKPANKEEIVIDSTGAPNQQNAYVDPKGVKHPNKVYWQAVNVATPYQIVLDSPPNPFGVGNDGPFPTDTTTGTTATLKVDKNLSNTPAGNPWTYHIYGPNRQGKFTSLSGGGIIIDG